VSLITPVKVRELQRALYAKAKANPAYRFYALYDKIYRKDVLLWAWSCCRANGGSAGVDGQSFAVGEPVHETLPIGLEATRLGKEAKSTHRDVTFNAISGNGRQIETGSSEKVFRVECGKQ
jgi:hypothetical protein